MAWKDTIKKNEDDDLDPYYTGNSHNFDEILKTLKWEIESTKKIIEETKTNPKVFGIEEPVDKEGQKFLDSQAEVSNGHLKLLEPMVPLLEKLVILDAKQSKYFIDNF